MLWIFVSFIGGHLIFLPGSKVKFERAAIIGVIQVAYFGQCSTLLRFLLWLVFSRRLVSSRPRKRRRRRPRTRRRNGNAAASVRLSCSHIISQRLQHLASATWSSINKFAAAAVLLCCCAAALFSLLILIFFQSNLFVGFLAALAQKHQRGIRPSFQQKSRRLVSFFSFITILLSAFGFYYYFFFFYFNVSPFHSDGSRWFSLYFPPQKKKNRHKQTQNQKLRPLGVTTTATSRISLRMIKTEPRSFHHIVLCPC